MLQETNCQTFQKHVMQKDALRDNPDKRECQEKMTGENDRRE